MTFKCKGLDFYIVEAIGIHHAVLSFLHYRIGVTENDIEAFKGEIPEDASVMTAI